MNNKGLNNKGFTLVELLAVILILLSISLIAVTNVSASLKRNDEQAIDAQEKMAISAAKIYFYEKGTMQNATYVKIQTLIDEGYILKEKIDKLKHNKYILLCTNSGYKFSTGTTGC